MQAELTPLSGVLVLRAKIHRDHRGHFLETWSQRHYEAAGLPAAFVQDNISLSSRGVLRGLHAQRVPCEQGKLVTALQGAVFDVVVDARRGSPTRGQWFGIELRANEGTQLWIPPGFLHGFQALEDSSIVLYKCTGPFHREAEFSTRWDDPAIGIQWPIEAPVLSAKDAGAPGFHELDQSWLMELPPELGDQ